MVPIDWPKHFTQHMSPSNSFSRMLTPQPEKDRHGDFFRVTQCEISVK